MSVPTAIIIVLGEVHLRRISDPMRTITTASELIDPWTRMRQSSRPVQRTGVISSAPSWADFITTMAEFKVFGTHSQCPTGQRR